MKPIGLLIIILIVFVGGCITYPQETYYHTVYPTHNCLDSSCRLDANGTVERAIEIWEHERRYRAKQLKNDEELQSKNWSQEVKKAIINSHIIIGMTEEQVRYSWGSPDDMNRSVGSWGVHEQWVFENQVYNYLRTTYVYFENGMLTSYQE
jgi:hypothetical protein